jgi:hypothetical protein
MHIKENTAAFVLNGVRGPAWKQGSTRNMQTRPIAAAVFVTILTAWLCAAPASAQTQDTAAQIKAAAGFAAPSPAAEAPRHPELLKFQRDGGKVEYIGHAYGLDGWLLSKGDDVPPRTVYTTPEGGLVIGQLLTPDGVIETAKQLLALRDRLQGSQASLPGADEANSAAAPSERFYAAVEKAQWAQVGKPDAPYLYVFMNVGCEHCQEYWKDLSPLVEAGKLQVRLVPYGAAAENRDGGAALLSVKDPGSAWSAYIKGDKQSLSKDRAIEGAAAGVDANGALLRKWQVAVMPPFTVYRRPGDGKINVIIGKPKNMMLLQADLVPKG